MAINSKENAAISDEETSNDEQMSDHESELDSDEDDMDMQEEDKLDLEASATDSDEDDSEIDDNVEDNKQKEEKSKSEKIKDQLLQRYQERQGKQLYIRFPHKVPETQEALDEQVKELVPLAVKAHKPRQRHARFCLVDFASKEDRDAALNKLKKSIKKGDLKKFAVNIPRTESSDFVQELAERKIKSFENKRAKQRLKKASKKALKEKNFTSSVIVLNLPKNVSTLQIRELFPNAVDINTKPGKGKINNNTSIAAVTFPTTLDARNATKKKLSLEGNELRIKFDNKKKLMKKNNCKSMPKNNEINENFEADTKQKKLASTLGNKKAKTPAKSPALKTNLKKNKKSNNVVKKKAKVEGK